MWIGDQSQKRLLHVLVGFTGWCMTVLIVCSNGRFGWIISRLLVMMCCCTKETVPETTASSKRGKDTLIISVCIYVCMMYGCRYITTICIKEYVWIYLYICEMYVCMYDMYIYVWHVCIYVCAWWFTFGACSAVTSFMPHAILSSCMMALSPDRMLSNRGTTRGTAAAMHYTMQYKLLTISDDLFIHACMHTYIKAREQNCLLR